MTVGGIRSTGLTASRAIAEYVAKELFGSESEIKVKADAIMPEIDPDDQHDEEDGFVKIGKFSFKVTHPLAQLGLVTPVPRVSKIAYYV